MSQAVTIRSVPGKPAEVYYPLALTRRHIPVPRENHLLIQLHAAALNRRDLFIRRHLYPGIGFDVPLFADGCGTVREAGLKTLERQWKGKRVILAPGQGWDASKLGPETSYTVRGGTVNAPEGVLQEWIVVDSSEVEEAPGHLTAEEAAALPLTGLTAWRALTTKSQNAVAGRNILITGAGGGVALMALLYARQMGINAYVNAASEERIEQAVKMGARGGVLFHDPSWPVKLYQMLPKERKYLDAVIDGAGADIAAKVVKLLKHGGTIVSYGMTAGPAVAFPMSAVMRNIQFHGTTVGSRCEFAEMVEYVKEHRIKPVIAQVVDGISDLRSIDDLFKTMQREEQFGKLVVRINDNIPCEAGKL